MMLKYVNKAKTAPENKTAINLPQKSNTLFFLLNIEIKPAMTQECMDRSTHSNKTQNITHLPFSLCAHGPVWLPWWRLQHRHSHTSTEPNGHIIYPQSNAALPCLHIFPMCVCSPMTETSYSIRNRASWPLCISMVKASACFSLFKGIPSMLNTRSPAFKVPSLEEHERRKREGGGEVKHRRPAQDAHTSVEAPVTVNH